MDSQVSNTTYLIGVLAAIFAGIIFNLGMVIQKIAVSRIPLETRLIHQLIRSPLWLAGFGLQFIIGTPLNMLAQSKIGPALIPGLMAIGLIVLSIGAVRFAGESFDFGDFVGILFVIIAVTIFGFSKLSVNMQTINIWEQGFLLRLFTFTLFLALLSFLCHFLQKTNIRMRGILRTLNAGLLLSQSNLWLGILMVFFSRWSVGKFSAEDLILAAISCAIVFAGSMLGIVETQRAFQFGEASKLIPIQYVPIQTLPIAAYFFVFNLSPSTQYSLPIALGGVLLVLCGAMLLARRQFA